MQLSRVVSTLVLLCAIARSARAEAPHPSARLSVARADGAQDCPGEADLRAAIAARLGYDPFRAPRPGAPLVEVAFSRVGRALAARLELREGDRAPRSRDLTSAESDCSELGATTALAISIAIDPASSGPAPLKAVVEPASPPSPPPPIEVPKAPGPPLDLPSPPKANSNAKEDRLMLHAGAGGVVVFGAAPAPAIGVGLEIGARWRAISLSVEGRAHAPASVDANGGGSVTSSLLIASLVPCGHVAWMRVCALGSGGAMQGQGSGRVRNERVSTGYAALGLRAGAEVPLWKSAFSADVHGDLTTPLTRTTLALDDRPAWVTPPIAGALAAGLVARFP